MYIIFDTIGRFRRSGLAAVAAAFMLAVMLAGCKTQEPSQTSSQSVPADSTPAPVTASPAVPPVTGTPGATNSLILQPGDNLRVSFPGAPTLDAQTTIRVDGKISLPMIGELQASGLTPSQLEKELLKIADPQLVVKEVSVTVISSVFEIYVSGAVLRPGKLTTDRVITPLEAVIESGLDYQRANLRSVQVIRKLDNGQTENFKINLKKPLKGQTSEPFALHQFDIIYVPERFNWF